MARPTKQGLSYFPLDVDFLQDIKIRKIMRACGNTSISILISLLCNIYKDNGYYILWDNDLPFLIADEVGVTEGAVVEVLKKALQVRLFSEEKYKKFSILTSRGIQDRFLKATDRRVKIQLESDYCIHDDDDNSINDDSNSINDDRSTQSKVKESKVNKSKENKSNMADFISDYLRDKSKEFSIAFTEFVEMKKNLKNPIKTKYQLTLLTNKLDELGKSEEERIQIINYSVMNSWKGFYPLKQEKQSENKKPTYQNQRDYEELDDLYFSWDKEK